MSHVDTFRPGAGELPARDAIPARYRWDLSSICASWDEWNRLYQQLDASINAFTAFQGTLASAASTLLAAFRAMDDMGALSYRVWYFTALQYDEDQRDNDINARRQQVQILFAREQQSSSWFNPELLAIPVEAIRRWMDASPALGLYRFAIESLFHEQEHVLDENGERLMSFAGRFNSVPNDTYSALTTADMKFPTLELSS